MADIQALDILHDMKHTEKGSKHVHNEHQIEKSSNSSNSAQDDLEKHPSHGAGYDLSEIPVADGEYVVTAKTWLVVIVSDELLGSSEGGQANFGGVTDCYYRYLLFLMVFPSG